MKNEQLRPPPDLLPGDPGWKPSPEPTPGHVSRLEEEMKTFAAEIDARMRIVRRESPFATAATKSRPMG